jgi:hypothetical protein
VGDMQVVVPLGHRISPHEHAHHEPTFGHVFDSGLRDTKAQWPLNARVGCSCLQCNEGWEH